MDEILDHLRNHGKPLFVGIYRGMIIPGVLMWCRLSSIHSTILGVALRGNQRKDTINVGVVSCVVVVGTDFSTPSRGMPSELLTEAAG